MSLVTPLLLLLALLRTPLFVIIAASAMLGFYSAEIDLSVISIEIYRLLRNNSPVPYICLRHVFQ